jgi:TldD protein
MGDLSEFEAELIRALTRLGRRTRFAEVLAQSVEGELVRLDRRSTSVRKSPRLKGAVLRAWNGGRWVEAAMSALDAEAVGRTTEALETSLWNTTAVSEPPGVSSSFRGEWTTLPPHPMRDVPPEELISLGRDVLSWGMAVPAIHDVRVEIAWNDEERFYLNTAGARCHQLLSRVREAVAPVAMENGRLESDVEGEGGMGGRERLALLTQEKVTEAAQNTVKLLRASPPPTGEMAVLLDPRCTGVFAHESFGHGTEADQFVRDRSYLKPILGKVVAPEFVTIVDSGAYPGEWGSMYFDDEGYPAQRTALVDRGRFVGALHDRVTAAAYHVRPTGNARRSDFLSRLFVRMTNTYVEPGDWSLDELVREARDGVLLEHPTMGIEDPQGGQMQIKLRRGRRIQHGELGDVVSSMALSGKVLDFLRSIRGVSRRSDFMMDPGSCGKGLTDLLPAGSGGSYLLATAVVGPA